MYTNADKHNYSRYWEHILIKLDVKNMLRCILLVKFNKILEIISFITHKLFPQTQSVFIYLVSQLCNDSGPCTKISSRGTLFDALNNLIELQK